MIETRITPPKNLNLNLKELWQHRELFYYFAWRDIKVKYKQTIFGFLWAIVQPLVLMVILYFFLANRLAHEGLKVPFMIYCLSGLVIWGIFSGGVTSAGNSMVHNAGIIQKIYFHRLIIPGSAIIVSIFDFIWAFLVFIILSISLYGFNYFTLLTPLYFIGGFILIIISALGLGTLISSFTIKYKDLRHALPFLMQVLLLGSSVIYPISFIKNEYIQYLLVLNPCMGAIELFRMGIDGYQTNMQLIYWNIGLNILIFFIGVFNFRRTEQYLADQI